MKKETLNMIEEINEVKAILASLEEENLVEENDEQLTLETEDWLDKEILFDEEVVNLGDCDSLENDCDNDGNFIDDSILSGLAFEGFQTPQSDIARILKASLIETAAEIEADLDRKMGLSQEFWDMCQELLVLLGERKELLVEIAERLQNIANEMEAQIKGDSKEETLS